MLDSTPIADGIRYARNQKAILSRFLEDGRLPIHNNSSELALRREAVGRKNWLFVGSDDAGTVNATFTSLLASCRMHQVEPWSYLRDLFCLLPRWPDHRLLELSPVEWTKTREKPDVVDLLARNPFRPPHPRPSRLSRALDAREERARTSDAFVERISKPVCATLSLPFER